MTSPNRRYLIAGSLMSAIVLTGCVSQSQYDSLQAQNQQLQTQNASLSQELAASKQQVSRLQGAIKYTVNSDLLFPPGGWQMASQGKAIIAKMASQLAPTQQNKIHVNGYTDNTPIGPELQRQGINTNQELSQKRAENVMEYIISQGVKPELVEAHGFGDAQPVASNDTAKGRAQNRRVELTLAGS
ncbi:MAG TPA: OmpA family protein [Acetobacteraceae bacterium]|jgi:chemotaxis protein MotB|nr:OmpA family protein [Acetobacteraceae bacterium]